MRITTMNYYFTGVLIVLLCLLTLCVKPAHSGSTQSNVSGSNTAIEGGYESTATTTYQSGSSSNSTTTSTSNSNIKSAPPTASAPSFSAQSQDVCATGVSAGVQTFGIGVSGGKTFRDLNCERIKLAKVLYDFGMKVGSVALLCQDERVFEAMINAGTPCPVDGKIGKDALAIWNKYEFERPDYKTYVKRIKKREVIDKKLEKEKVIIPLKKPVNWNNPK
jgi:hypothetical protein